MIGNVVAGLFGVGALPGNVWATKTVMTAAKDRMGAAAVGTVVYVPGGVNTALSANTITLLLPLVLLFMQLVVLTLPMPQRQQITPMTPLQTLGVLRPQLPRQGIKQAELLLELSFML